MSNQNPEFVPDGNFKLDARARSELEPAFDPDALEELLARCQTPAQRDQALHEFLKIAGRAARGEIVITGIGTIGETTAVEAAAHKVARNVQNSLSACGFHQPAPPEPNIGR